MSYWACFLLSPTVSLCSDFLAELHYGYMCLLQVLRAPEGRYPVLFSLKPKLLSLIDCPLSVTSHLVLGKSSNVLRPLPHISRQGIITLGGTQGHVGEGNNAVWFLGLKRGTWSMDALGKASHRVHGGCTDTE